MKRYFTAPKADMQTDLFHLGEYHYIDNGNGTVTVVLFNCKSPPATWTELPHLLNGGYAKAKQLAAIHPMFEP